MREYAFNSSLGLPDDLPAFQRAIDAVPEEEWARGEVVTLQNGWRVLPIVPANEGRRVELAKGTVV